MLNHLFESAAAELARCVELEPDRPELLFERARLAMFGVGRDGDASEAIELLERVLEASPEDVRAHRLLFELFMRRGEQARAGVHRAAVEERYGDIGGLEMEAYLTFLRKGSKTTVPFSEENLEQFSTDYQDLTRAFLMLERVGEYAPTVGVPILERLMEKYPDLAMLRYVYGRALVKAEIRVDFSPGPGQPPMSSRVIADYAQSHLERAFDQLYPGSALGYEIVLELSDVALRMADYDEAIQNYDILLDVIHEGFWHRSLLGQKGLALYKQRSYPEAIDLLEQALRGEDSTRGLYLPHLWILHLAYEDSGVPTGEREFPFRFRPDLPLAGSPTELAFIDIAPRLKINKLDGVGPSAWGDVDGDGDFDLFVSGQDSYGALYRNDGDVFTDASLDGGFLHAQSGFSSTLVDYDNDGDLDLYVGRDGWSGASKNSLYQNDGTGRFTDVTTGSGLGDPGTAFVVAWTDYDRDGDLDVYVCNGITGGGDTNVLYRNNGDGSFTDVTSSAGLQERSGIKTIGVAIGDYDKDGWPDIFVSGFGTLNRLYHNKGDGTFDEVAATAGVAGADHISTGYTCFFVDYDNDADLDILRASLAPWRDVLKGLSDQWDGVPPAEKNAMLRHATKLYRNDGDGTFTDVSYRAGFVHPVGTMGSGVADVNNDGYTDVYLATGDPGIGRLEPDRFYLNNGNGSFTDVTFAVGLGNVGKGHGITFVDLDDDGDLEIYAPEGGFWHGDPFPNALYLNEQTTGNHWLHVDLVGRESNRDGVGTRLTLRAGELLVYTEKFGGRGFGSTDSPPVEFGLGTATTVDSLELVWPSGIEQLFRDLSVDRRIRIEEGGEPVDLSPRAGQRH
jgi:tetratricopeptide (TPR) repeat protein